MEFNGDSILIGGGLGAPKGRGLPFATSTACIPAANEIKKAKMLIAAMNVFLLIAIK